MVPTLADGCHVWIDPGASVEAGAVVAARHPDAGRNLVLIKRVAVIEPSGGVHLLSDNPAEGTDSRRFGAVDRTAVLGVVTWCSEPWGRVRARPEASAEERWP